MTTQSKLSVPWWAPATPAAPEKRPTWRDLWDALFGKREAFFKVELDGSWFICEKRDLWQSVGSELSGDVYTITEVRMTRRQFEALPEFTGF